MTIGWTNGSARLSILLAAALAMGIGASAVSAQSMERERISIDSDWKFTKDDPADAGDALAYKTIKQWMVANGNELVKDPAERHARPEGNGANIGENVAYTHADFDDSQWRSLNLPHDWAIEGPFKTEFSGATGRLPFWGIGWYRRHLNIPAADAGKQFFIDIDGAMAYPNVWVNGKYVGGWGYGYSSFRLDLSPYIKTGADNVIAIRLDNPASSSRWYPGGGIYRNVWLTKPAPVHVAQWGTYLTTPQVSEAAADVDLKVTVENSSAAPATIAVMTEIRAMNMDDQVSDVAIARSEAAPLDVPAGQRADVSTKVSIPNPQLWSIEKPTRYVAVTTLQQGGRMIDRYETPFGVRTIKFDADKGFLLNGVHVKFNGVCDHQDLGALGSAINVRALQRQLEILREMGCNAIRTSHNPPTPELLNLCDKMGFVVMDESFDCWLARKTPNDYNLLFSDWSEKDMRALIRRDRNHPSVVMWSIGNEISEQGSEAGHKVGQRLADFVHEEDPTRPVTAACNNLSAGYNGFQNVVDVFGYNYKPTEYTKFHQQNPTKFLFGSETASTISTRGEYRFPVSDNKANGELDDVHQMSSYDLYAPRWATPPDAEFKGQDQNSFVAGEFVWTGFDYLGEPTPWGGRTDPSRSSYFGIIDLAGFKKDRFYIYQAKWRPDFPMAHILPHWNWADRLGEVTPVHVYTSGDEGELFLNGTSLGRKKKAADEYRLRWDDVKYAPGELKVVTYKEGKPWAEATMKTTGAAAKLTAVADRADIKGDGQDLSYVTVSVADDAGAMVPRSMNLLKFSIDGPGEIVAVDNGDPTSYVPFQSKEMKAFNGLCLVIVRGKPGNAGAITLHAESDDLAAASVVVNSSK